MQSSLGGGLNTLPANLFGNLGGLVPSSTATPSLPAFNPLAGLSQEQLQQLALLQYLQNPLFAGGLLNQQPQVITTSKPILRTETLFSTSTIPLFLGAKKFFTTLTQAVGVTTITDYEMATQTVAPAAAPNAALFGLQQQQQQPKQQQQQQRPQLPGLTVTSEAVVKDTTVPSTVTKEIRITFRNTPTVTKLTSTTMVQTQITEYVTRTVRAQPTLAPGVGLGGFGGYNPLAALLG